jgi:hypothetical protein
MGSGYFLGDSICQEFLAAKIPFSSLANPSWQSAGVPEFIVQVALRLLVVLYREIRRIDLMEQVHVGARILLPGIRIHYDYLETFNLSLGLEAGERILVSGEFLAGCCESGFSICCEFRGVA